MDIHSPNTAHLEDKTPCFTKSLKKFLLNWREHVTNAPMPLHLLAWKTWNFLCDLPYSELSKGSSDRGEVLVRAAPRTACKPVLQSWEAVAAGAGRANAVWLWLCSYAGWQWNVRGLKTGKGITGALLELFFWLHAEGWISLFYGCNHSIAVGTHSQSTWPWFPACSQLLVRAGEAMGWFGTMDQREAGWVTELPVPFTTA